jgi:hypothetical protein
MNTYIKSRPVIVKHNAASKSAALCLLGAAALAAPQAFAQEGSSDWKFAASIYGWFPDIGGHTEFPSGGGGDIDVDVSTILDHLKFTLQGSFEIHKGHWGAFTDLVYLDVGETKSGTRALSIGGVQLPATVSASAEFDLKSTFWTIAGSYRVADSADANFDLLLGARLADFNQSLNWTFTGDFGPVTPPPLTGSRNSSVEQWDAIVGAKGRKAFGSNEQWAVRYYLDLGTGDSDLTFQAMLALGYAFEWGDISVAWRYLDYDLEPGGPVTDMNFSGPAIGASFRW